MEEAEHALWRAAGLSIGAAEKTGGWPRVAAAFDYKSPLRFEDEFDVTVHIAEMTAPFDSVRFHDHSRRRPGRHRHDDRGLHEEGKTASCAPSNLPADVVDRLRAGRR